jgi:hypothetical protein
VNEDDDKLNTSITEKEDQKSVLIVGGIKMFLPSNQLEAIISVASAKTKVQPTETVKEDEEKEKTLIFSPA